MVYADYEYYTQSYGGSVIPVERFAFAARTASRHLDAFTFGRITDAVLEKHSEIKDCICEMAEAVYASAFSGNHEKRSENIDGYSVSYVVAGRDGESRQATLTRTLYGIAATHLGNTGLLYRGGSIC